jgi:hypothetical protein
MKQYYKNYRANFTLTEYLQVNLLHQVNKSKWIALTQRLFGDHKLVSHLQM